MPTAALPDGREVDTASEDWRRHCLQRHDQRRALVARHVATLQRMQGPGSRQQRARYLATVAVADGQQVADDVQAEFLRLWEARKPPTG